MSDLLNKIQEWNCKDRLSGFSYRLADDKFGMDTIIPMELDIDESNMSVKIPFADGNRRDGVGDLLEISGIDTSRHRTNPIVLFDHGKNHSLPIGLAEDKEGKYTVELNLVENKAFGTCFFYQGENSEHSLFCDQLFDLVARRYVRAGSIGYQVKRAIPLPPIPDSGTPEGLHLLSVLMLEFSIVIMPANQDTVRKVLSMKKISGCTPSPVLVKSFENFCNGDVKTMVTVPSINSIKTLENKEEDDPLELDLNKEEVKLLRKKYRKMVEERSVSKMKREVKEAPAKIKELKAKKKSDVLPGEDDEMEQLEEHKDLEDEQVEEPLGAQALRRMHEDCSILMRDYDKITPLLEHVGVKERLLTKLMDLEEELSSIEESFTKEYPDLKSLDDYDDSEDLEEEDSELEEEEENVEEDTEDLEEDLEEEEDVSAEDAMDGMGKALKEVRKKYKKKCVDCEEHTKNEEEFEEQEVKNTPENQEEDFSDSEYKTIGESSEFLKSMSEESNFDDEKRMNSYHHHKLLDPISSLVSNDQKMMTHRVTLGKACNYLKRMSSEKAFGDVHKEEALVHHKGLNNIVSSRKVLTPEKEVPVENVVDENTKSLFEKQSKQLLELKNKLESIVSI